MTVVFSQPAVAPQMNAASTLSSRRSCIASSGESTVTVCTSFLSARRSCGGEDHCTATRRP